MSPTELRITTTRDIEKSKGRRDNAKLLSNAMLNKNGEESIYYTVDCEWMAQVLCVLHSVNVSTSE